MNRNSLVRFTIQTLFMALLVSGFFACQDLVEKPIEFPRTDLSTSAFIPLPLKILPTHDAFGLDKNTAIFTSESDGDFEGVAKFLSQKILDKTNLQLPINQTDTERVRAIYLNKTDNLENRESYELYITRDSVLINAGTAEGAFRAVQTLRQAIPETSNDTLSDHPIWPIPTGKITDTPQFAYRGSMLDVARHFFTVEDVKKYIDILAYYKINVLHMHLTDDQGWRIEIKSWPRLTEIGGSTEVGGEAGGFYTQEDYKEIVAYAAEHFITIVPEVDMPGHTNAASVSYPFLNGNGKTPELYEGTHVGFSTFDTRKDTVYAFIDDVIREIAEMSPGPYFHIGGDESHVTKKNDYIYFVERVHSIVKKHGKKMIGWDEIANADLDESAIAQFWASEDNATKAVTQNMKVILSPAKKMYLDMQYDTVSAYGLHWAAYIPVDTAYAWHPERYSAGISKENILGIEAPLWSETISEINELEYLAFPRVIGHAELGWTVPEKRDWETYKVRLASQTPYLDRMDVHFYPSDRVPWPEDHQNPWEVKSEIELD